jgi:hypothetical protein
MPLHKAASNSWKVVDGGSKWRRGAAEFGGAVLVKFSERREWCVAEEV